MNNKDRLDIILEGYKTSPSKIEIGVYILTHKETGKRYHGSTSNLHRRLTEHKGDLIRQDHGNDLLLECARLHGVFHVDFIPTETIELAVELEDRLIAEESEESRLNLSLSARAGFSRDKKNPLTSAKISAAKLGNINGHDYLWPEEKRASHSARMIGNAYRRGIPHDEEAKKRMAVARIGKRVSQEAVAASILGRTKRSVAINDDTYLTVTDASRATGHAPATIIRKCEDETVLNYRFISPIRIDEMDLKEKQCNTDKGCGRIKAISEFRKVPNKNSYFGYCRECETRLKREHRVRLVEMPYESKEDYRKLQSGRTKAFYNDPAIDAIPTVKKCQRKACQKVKNILDFPFANSSPDGHNAFCLECINGNYKKRKKYPPSEISEKECKGACGKIRPISQFNINSLSPDGYKYICRACDKERHENHVLSGGQEKALKDNSDFLCRKFQLIFEEEKYYKLCSKCTFPKLVGDFRKDASSFDGYSSLCKFHTSRNQPDLFETAKLAAYAILKTALSAGLLLRPDTCEKCKTRAEPIHGHHHDYTKPLDVGWLCTKCHSDWHHSHDFFKLIMLPEDIVKDRAAELRVLYENYFVLYNQGEIKCVVFVVPKT